MANNALFAKPSTSTMLLSDELIVDVWKHYINGESKGTGGSARRLRAIMLFRCLNSHLRDLLLRTPSLWNPIDLSWPSPSVALLLPRPSNENTGSVSAVLDAEEGGNGLHGRRVDNLTTHLSLLSSMEISIRHPPDMENLAIALTGNAPKLHTLVINLSADVPSIGNLFAAGAPLLRKMSLSPALIIQATPFHTLRELNILVTTFNYPDLLPSLREMPYLQSLVMTGGENSAAIHSDPPPARITFNACRTLIIQGMDIPRARYLSSKTRVPNVIIYRLSPTTTRTASR
ncbi:hypothetical protein SISNIDRAFT_549478 [Sistotremastrum niveocremeum HHB9708]|uniref:F-box domain-containing protein n=1 Tax=Sistotremastrum niveocremeum HHB9708 TaxID=1314777 RepID=A0A164UYJ7_9AGAM|nr:hypothetical protein SISNIDRAFT_549478 [Sistotremastrum niveocremeum HHB9708]